MEKDQVCEAHEEDRDGDEDAEKSRDNGKEIDMESMMCVMREVESTFSAKEIKPIDPHDRDHRDQGRKSDEDGLKETKPDTERERNHGAYNKRGEERHMVSQEIDVVSDISDSVTKRMVGDPPVRTVREDCLHRSRYSELAGDMGQIGREDLAAQGGIDAAYQPKAYKAEMSSEKFPDTACLAASCPEGSPMDYPYVDFNTSEFMVMCDFVAADDTQLSLSQGDKVLLLNAVTAEWWWVEHNGRCGYVPATHLCGVDDEEHSDIEDPWQDEEYYGSYKTLKLHLEMLSDQPRTQTYRNVIRQNSAALKGKRILDLGCGTGIISFFCAQLAEPEMVYAVEASKIAEQTRKLVDENGYSSIVQVLSQRAEELQLPAKVDVLVSEWMGTCLLFEFMLESVLLARDQWLKEDGMMWPSTARIHMVPCSADKEYASRVLFWDSPYSLDFSVLKPMAIREFFSRPKPDYVLKPEDCLAQPCTLLDVNMKTLKIEDLERMDSKFHFHVDHDGAFHGFMAWFSVQFQNMDNQEQVELDTGPFNPLTHWKHTLFMLDKPLQVHSGDRIAGSVVFKRNPIWRRHLSVTITWSISSISLTTIQDGCKVFPIWR